MTTGTITAGIALDPIGIVGNGSQALFVVQRLQETANARLILHGFAPPPIPATRKRQRNETAANLFDLASECEVIFCAFDDSATLRTAIAGTADRPGMAGALRPGTLLIDLTAAKPQERARLAGDLARGAIGYIEAILPSPGQPLVLLGGFGPHIEAVTPLLAAFGEPRRIGSQGQAQAFATLIAARAAARAALDNELGAIAGALGFPPVVPQTDFSESSLALVHQARALAQAAGIVSPLLDALVPPALR